MTSSLADEIVDSLRDKQSKPMTARIVPRARSDYSKKKPKSSSAYVEDDSDTEEYEEEEEVPNENVDSSNIAIAPSPRKRKPSRAVTDYVTDSQESFLADETEASLAQKSKGPRRRKNLDPAEVKPDLGPCKPIKKPIGRPRKNPLPVLPEDSQPTRYGNEGAILKTVRKAGRFGAKRESSGLTPGLTFMDLRATPNHRMFHSPAVTDTPNQNGNALRTGMTPFEHHFAEYELHEYSSNGQDIEFSPSQVFSSPLEASGIASSGRNLRSSLSNLEQSPRTAKSIHVLNSNFSEMKSEYGLLPPLPSARSSNRHRLLSSGSFIADETADDGEMVEDSALDISHIDVAEDYEGQSPDSMLAVDEVNATFSSLGNISMMHSPDDEEEHEHEGDTPYLQSLLFSTEKKELRVNKRKLAAEDEEEAMTGSRLVSGYQESPSKMHMSFRFAYYDFIFIYYV